VAPRVPECLGTWLSLENPTQYSLYPERKARTMDAARQAYLGTFGFMALMQAIDGLTPHVTSQFKPIVDPNATQ
jgi:hypothetical protein